MFVLGKVSKNKKIREIMRVNQVCYFWGNSQNKKRVYLKVNTFSKIFQKHMKLKKYFR